MPMAPSAVVVGRCLADMLYSVVSLALLVASGSPSAGAGTARPAETLAAFGLLLLLRMAFLWIGIFLGLGPRAPRWPTRSSGCCTR